MAKKIKAIKCEACDKMSGCFKMLNIQQLSDADDQRLEVKYKAGETICKQGSFASHILFLRRGLARVFMEGRDKNMILSIIPEGNYIGLTSLFGDSIFHYSAIAYEDCEVCLLDINLFKEFILQNADFSAAVIRDINFSTIRAFERLLSVSQKNIPGRFADLILYLSEDIFKSDEFIIPFSRKELAELASMSIESLSRILKDFNSDGMVEIRGKNIQIKNVDKLKMVSING
ncbi:Crp/Fnr family transcriptional regulator [Bacteroidota bacterium]